MDTGNKSAGAEENWCAQELAAEQLKGHAKLQPPPVLKTLFRIRKTSLGV